MSKNTKYTCQKCQTVWLGLKDTKKPRCVNKACRSVDVVRGNELSSDEVKAFRKEQKTAAAPTSPVQAEALSVQEKGKMESPIPPKQYEKIDLQKKTEEDIVAAQKRIDETIDLRCKTARNDLALIGSRIKAWVHKIFPSK